MDQTNQYKYINKVNFIRRGIRCHGISLKKCYIIYIRGIRSWHLTKFRKYIKSKFPEFYDSVIAIKQVININDNFFQVKSTAPENSVKEFITKFNSLIKSSNCSFAKGKGHSHKINFSHLRREFFTSSFNNKSKSSLNNCNDTSICKSNNSSYDSNTNWFDADSNECYRLLHNKIHESISLCLSWNTNGWNFEKKDGIEYFNSLFKPIFLCFQETGNGTELTSNSPCKVYLPNYKYFCKRVDKSIPGLRGLYLFYDRSIQASLENNDLNYIISLSTYSLWNNSKCSIGNIYVPHKNHHTFHRLAKAEISTWLSSHTAHPSLLVGDYNIPLEKLKDWISKFNDWYILEINGSPISWISGNRKSAIDHAIVNGKMKELIFSASFIEFPPISDHRPLLIVSKNIVKDNSFILPKKSARVVWDRLKCLEKCEDIIHNNKFDILQNDFMDGNLSSNQMYGKFVSVSKSIAKDLELTSSKEICRKMFHMSQKIFDLQKLKMKAYKDIKRLGTTQALDVFLRLMKNYRNLCDIVHDKCNHFRRLEYLHRIKIGCEMAINRDSRNWWKWIKENVKVGKFTARSSCPIRNKNGDLVTTIPEQLDVWHDYYEDLSSDPSGHSLYKPYWSNPANKELYDYKKNKEWDINQDISIDEIVSAIESTPNFKASGPDDIPIELFKALFYRNEDNEIVYGAGLSCLHHIFNNIWNGDFPRKWNKASIVSIPKKGDLTDCNNYRGISLINNIIKIISKIVASRISSYGINNNFIRPEQFGFRNKEECISLYISIREICQRRKFSGKDTFLAFLDLRKAYDTVPIYNILNKIECLGIRGKSLQFIRNLYLSSKACVKLNSQLSNSFNVKKGVRQGCPLSPILFNLFINDVFKDCEQHGVSLKSAICCGSLFADDIVLCSPTRGRLLKKVNKWAKYNPMSYGINKCATMVVKALNSRVA